MTGLKGTSCRSSSAWRPAHRIAELAVGAHALHQQLPQVRGVHLCLLLGGSSTGAAQLLPAGQGPATVLPKVGDCA